MNFMTILSTECSSGSPFKVLPGLKSWCQQALYYSFDFQGWITFNPRNEGWISCLWVVGLCLWVQSLPVGSALASKAACITAHPVCHSLSKDGSNLHMLWFSLPSLLSHLTHYGKKFPAFKDSCDYIRIPWTVQDDLSILSFVI